MSISNDIGYIVADKFESLRYVDNIMTFTDFIQLVLKGGLVYNLCEVGLGLNEYELNILRVVNRSLQGVDIIFPNYERASNVLTHKVKQENIMVTDPEKINDTLFVASLVPNDNCAEMSDHMTGKHIQGMVLMESARQLMLAVGEKYVLTEEDQNNMYCLLGELNIDFKRFVFPVETRMECEVKSLVSRPGKKYKATMLVSFFQKEQLCAGVTLDVSFHKKSYMENIETELLGKVVTLQEVELKKAVNHA